MGVRPLIARLARSSGLSGCVFNEGGSVCIQVQAGNDACKQFLDQLKNNLNLKNSAVEIQEVPVLPNGKMWHLHPECHSAVQARRFVIAASRRQSLSETALAALDLPLDIGICTECQRELGEPAKRHQYLLNACAQCGPRYTVLQAMPFDRAHTAMANFEPCETCSREYRDAEDRRYHAQLIACRDCGPQYWLENASGQHLVDCRQPSSLVADLASVLQQGGVVAIKGIGGFHLCCDAANDEAVNRIRHIKGRPEKPFAVMATLDQIAPYVDLNATAIEQLNTDARPVVLLPQRRLLGNQVAPGLCRLGVMLPYTGLQLLLLQAVGRPLVMTSANLSGEPITVNNKDLRLIQPQVDRVAFHDRDIYQGIDDSVMQADQVLRLGRGLAPKAYRLTFSTTAKRPANPEPIKSKSASQSTVLAMGAELKNSVALTFGNTISLSPYIGDLYAAGVFQRHQETIHRFQELLSLRPNAIAIDMHPDYHSSQYGRYLAEQLQIATLAIQHHHAHGVATMVEHQLPADEPVFALVMDGFGWGDDNSLWGGEILRLTYQSYRRLAHLTPFPVVGGQLAAQQPWRNSLALAAAFSTTQQEAFLAQLKVPHEKQATVNRMRALLNCAEHEHRDTRAADRWLQTSSVGRLFDGVAALLGYPRFTMPYEGHAAIWLQQLAESYQHKKVTEGKPQATGLDAAEFLTQLLEEKNSTEECYQWQSRWAYDFHQWLAIAFSSELKKLKQQYPTINKVVLAGGVMQNSLLLTLLRRKISALGFQVYYSQQIPTNDNGIALGQAAIATAQLAARG